MILAGLISSLGLLFLLFKFGPRRIISYDIPIDIAATVLLMVLFAGTFSGMMAAMFGGLIISVTLFAMRQTMIREQLSLVKVKKFPYRAWRWVEVDPDGK
jgi:hypothetical protein